MDLNIGQKLWKRAKNIIPGGNMLLSKRPEMYLPEKWPTYYKKAKGCFVGLGKYKIHRYVINECWYKYFRLCK